jgi:hypothetical protein
MMAPVQIESVPMARLQKTPGWASGKKKLKRKVWQPYWLLTDTFSKG